MKYSVKLRIAFESEQDVHPYTFTKVCDFDTYEECFSWFQNFMWGEAQELKRVFHKVDHASFNVKERVGIANFKYRFSLEFTF